MGWGEAADRTGMKSWGSARCSGRRLMISLHILMTVIVVVIAHGTGVVYTFAVGLGLACAAAIGALGAPVALEWVP